MKSRELLVVEFLMEVARCGVFQTYVPVLEGVGA